MSAVTAQAHGQAPAPRLGTHRAVSLVAVIGLFWPAFSAWSDIVSVPSAGLGVVALTGGALWLVCAIATARTEVELARLDRWVLAVALLVLTAWLADALLHAGVYGTDEAAFTQQAATALLHGHDPYGANLAGSLDRFGVPQKFWTYTMDGGTVTSYGYPALPLLVVAPFVLLTGGGQAVPIADAAVLMLAAVLMFKVLPPGWRALAAVACVGFPTLSNLTLAGINTIIMIATLVIVAHRWSHTGERGGLTRGDRGRAIALGLGLATNQLAWLVTPFLLVGIYLARRPLLGRRRAALLIAAYGAYAAAAFAAVNLPFVIWNPGAWLGAVAEPLTQHALPYGQGLIDLSLFLRVGGGRLDAYAYGAGCLYLALLLAYALRFRRLGRACFALPLAALFVSGRSLAEYWLSLAAVILVAVLTCEEHSFSRAAELWDRARWRSRGAGARLPIGVVFAPAAVWLALALATPQPLSLRIVAARSHGAAGVGWLEVIAHNGSGQPLSPHFSANVSGQAMDFWTVVQGPRTLAPGATARYELKMTDSESMPPNGTKFVLQAVTAAPLTISATAAYSHPGPTIATW